MPALPRVLAPPWKPRARADAMKGTGRPARTMPNARARGIANRWIGRVKCRNGSATQPGQWRPKAKPAGANGDQQAKPGKKRHETQAGDQTNPGTQYQPSPSPNPQRP